MRLKKCSRQQYLRFAEANLTSVDYVSNHVFTVINDIISTKHAKKKKKTQVCITLAVRDKFHHDRLSVILQWIFVQ